MAADSTGITGRVAARAAYAAAACNLAAALAMLLVLRPGLPGQGYLLEERAAFVASHSAVWSIGWLLWGAAAITLLAFYVGLAAQWSTTAPLRCQLALVCATAGLAADIGTEALYAGIGVRLGTAPFAVVEVVAGLLTGYVANGLYTVAGILLVWAGARHLPGWLIALSVPVWVTGIALSASSLAGSLTGQTVSTAALMPAFVLWAALTGRWLATRSS